MSATYVKLASNGDPVFRVTEPMRKCGTVAQYLGLDQEVGTALLGLYEKLGDGYNMHISYISNTRRDGTKREMLHLDIVKGKSEKVLYELYSTYAHTSLRKRGSREPMHTSERHFDTPLRQRIRDHRRAGALVFGVEQQPFGCWVHDLK